VVSALRFFGTAFFNTNIAVQALCIAALFSFAWLVRDLARALPSLRFA
jgi:hypothetical protein